MTRRSIVRDATAMILAVELVCGIVLCSTAILHERHARFHELDEMLRGSTDSLVGVVQDAEDPEDRLTVNSEEFRSRHGDLYVAYSPDHRMIGASEDAAKSLTLQPENGFHTLRLNGHRYRVYQRDAMRIIDRYETGGAGLRRPFTVVYAMPTDHIWHEILDATRFYILLSVSLFFLSAVLLVALLRWLLRPLRALATEAGGVDAHSLQFTPPDSALRTVELRPVAEAIEQSITRLKDAFDLQRRFISDAAHELKTAVAVVRSSVQVLTLRARSAEEYRSGLDRVLADNARVEDLISRMLTLARFEETTATGSCNLDEQLHAVLLELEPSASLAGITLRATGSAPCTSQLSANVAKTLISNLVVNAIQHSPKGSEVLVRISSSGSNETLLEVQDFGSGIAPESLPRVFDRFFREDPSRSRVTGGAGLGLAICKSIVEGVGGQIQIQSNLGSGTLVTVLLPSA
ncbi:MAG: HAMP domain-containing sensor histidine kinase [Terracidiphilus sp.]|nr:HAMP domain-containing sensor histidine kinase [Terracidiphilus sp.]